jgi:hypothetical protein
MRSSIFPVRNRYVLKKGKVVNDRKLRPLGQEKKQGQTHKVDPANWTVLCGGN